MEIGPGLRATSQASKNKKIIGTIKRKNMFRCSISKVIKMSRIIMIERP
jgi:hypothetical protein